MSYIDFRNIRKSFGKNQVLREISLSVEKVSLRRCSDRRDAGKALSSGVWPDSKRSTREAFCWTERI